jgi:chromosome segregation ATPase
MITAPTDNIKLTDEHLAQIQEGENRLSNLESLITIANRNLKIAKLELERTTKDILLQTEKLATLAPQIETAETKYKDLTDQFNDGKKSLEKVNDEILSKTETHRTKEVELDNREAKSLAIQNSLNKESEELNNNKAEHETSVKDFNSKVAKLKEVISTF